MERDFFIRSARSRAVTERRAMIDRGNKLALVRQCLLLGISRSGVYYRGREVAELDLRLMRLIDEVHLRYPFYGSRRIRDWIET